MSTFPPRRDGEKWQALYAVTGTEAAEIAIQLSRVASGNIPLLALTNSYHGSYGTAMAASGGSSCRHDLPETGGVFHLHAPIYHWKSRIDDLLEMAETTIKSSTSGKISGFIFETLQGYGGIHVLPNDYINRMAALTHKYGGYVIADEIQTGFGRMGSAYWAYQMSGVEPDIVIIAKGLGCGHPISAIVAKESVFARFNATGAHKCHIFANQSIPLIALCRQIYFLHLRSQPHVRGRRMRRTFAITCFCSDVT